MTEYTQSPLPGSGRLRALGPVEYTHPARNGGVLATLTGYIVGPQVMLAPCAYGLDAHKILQSLEMEVTPRTLALAAIALTENGNRGLMFAHRATDNPDPSVSSIVHKLKAAGLSPWQPLRCPLDDIESGGAIWLTAFAPTGESAEVAKYLSEGWGWECNEELRRAVRSWVGRAERDYAARLQALVASRNNRG